MLVAWVWSSRKRNGHNPNPRGLESYCAPGLRSLPSSPLLEQDNREILSQGPEHNQGARSTENCPGEKRPRALGVSVTFHQLLRLAPPKLDPLSLSSRVMMRNASEEKPKYTTGILLLRHSDVSPRSPECRGRASLQCK